MNFHKELQEQNQIVKECKEETKNVELNKENVGKEDIDIDLDDPEVDKAALKIQSSFRGHKARKEVHEMKENTPIDKEVEKEESSRIWYYIYQTCQTLQCLINQSKNCMTLLFVYYWFYLSQLITLLTSLPYKPSQLFTSL